MRSAVTIRRPNLAGKRQDSVLAPMRHRVRNLPTRPIAKALNPTPTVFAHIPAASLDRFVEAVHVYDDEPVLRYTQRLELIHLATSLEIRRFDANLIIAAIERSARPTIPQPATTTSPSRLAWTIAGTVQCLLIGGVWWMIHL